MNEGRPSPFFVVVLLYKFWLLELNGIFEVLASSSNDEKAKSYVEISHRARSKACSLA